MKKIKTENTHKDTKKVTLLDRILKDYNKDTKDTNDKNTLDIKDNKDIKNKNNWKTTDYIHIYNPYNIEKNDNIKYILSFDLDSTLIETVSGKTYANDSNDWKLYVDKEDEIIEEKYKSYSKKINNITDINDSKDTNDIINNTTALVIFSNQRGLKGGYLDEGVFKSKIEKIISRLNAKHRLPFICLFSNNDGYYRKPSIGMFEYLHQNFFPNLIAKESLYVGDAAGRSASGNRKKDFADTDYKFALNCNMKFMIPEEFFHNVKMDIPEIKFNPNIHFKDHIKEHHLNHEKYEENLKKLEISPLKTNPVFNKLYNDILNKEKIVIIFIGAPGSGKSTFFFNYFHPLNFGRVNNDTLKTEKKCVTKMQEILDNGMSVVIDNTSPTKTKRKVFIEIAKKNKAKTYCIYFELTKELTFHLNNQRKLLETLEKENSIKLNNSEPLKNPIPVHSFFKLLEFPCKEEGFDDVIILPFIPGPFKTHHHKKTFFLLS